jgi:predicted amidohydrolase
MSLKKTFAIITLILAVILVGQYLQSADAKVYREKVTIAVINFEPIQGDKPATLKKIKDVTTIAAQQGAEIIVFPETALTGWAGFPAEKAPELAETIPGPATDAIGKLAAELNVYVCVGMIEKKNGKTYNSAVVIGPSGLLGVYRKTHPFEPGEPWATAGNEYPLIETPWGPVGLGICVEDYLYPEIARIYALGGVRILLHLTAFPEFPDAKDYREFLKTTLGARAVENNMFVACANLVGVEGTFSFFGYSTIIGPKPGQMNYHIFAGPAGTGEEILTATLDLTSLDRLPIGVRGIFERRRPETYSILTR